jgi:hypothetical protein
MQPRRSLTAVALTAAAVLVPTAVASATPANRTDRSCRSCRSSMAVIQGGCEGGQSRWKISVNGVMFSSARPSMPTKNGSISACHRALTSVRPIAAWAASKSSVSR